MLTSYREVWFVDFEFEAPEGDPPTPVCMVAVELSSGRTLKLFRDELFARAEPPHSVSHDVLIVAYLASAELGCYLSLGWPPPANILDLYAESRIITNGLQLPSGTGLLGALRHLGLDQLLLLDKEQMRELAMRGGPWTPQEQADLLNYCLKDCLALRDLLTEMLPAIDLPRALLRGRYMQSLASIERTGIPVDHVIVSVLKTHWHEIKLEFVAQLDAERRIYDGCSFRVERFERWLSEEQIQWPRRISGALKVG